MDEKELIGEWSESIKAFWFGANNCEWIAWNGSNQIFVYPSQDYPKLPKQVIQHDKRIESIEEFTNAMNNGRLHDCVYKEVPAYWQVKK
jgi:hypothetical protein